MDVKLDQFSQKEGLTQEDIEYLRHPIKALDYATKYGVTLDRVQSMISSGKLRAIVSQDILWVDALIQPEIEGTVLSNLIKDIWQGNLGLAITYWAYGVLGGVLWAALFIALQPKPGGIAEIFCRALFVAYYVLVYVGIWRAADKYKGEKVWAVLAKFMILIIVLPLSILILKKLVSFYGWAI